MQEQQKTEIFNLLTEKLKQTSQNRFANTAQVSSATISQMVNKNWELISDDMWRKVGNALAWGETEYTIVNIPNQAMVFGLLGLARSNSMSFGISFSAGSGKSESQKLFCSQNKNAFYMECDKHWTSKMFMEKLLVSMGLKAEGHTQQEMAERVIGHLRQLEKPLIVLDEFDKLNDTQMMFFISMYNKLDGKCGIIISGSPALRKKIVRKVKANVTGFEEIFSRIGRKFMPLNELTHDDVKRICNANGVYDVREVSDIFDMCEGDLRKVKREIILARERNKTKTNAA